VSVFQSSLLTLSLAFASALASIAGYVVQVGTVNSLEQPLQPDTESTESPPQTNPSQPTTAPSTVATAPKPIEPIAISPRLPKGVDWKSGDLLVLVSGFDLKLVKGSQYLEGLGAIDKDWKSELVGGSVYAVDKSACRSWGQTPKLTEDYYSSGEFPKAIKELQSDLAAIRAARAGAKFHTLVIYYSSVAPDEEAALNAFADATLYWCGSALEEQRDCKVLNRLFPRPRFIAGGTLDQSAPRAAFANWRTAFRQK